MTIPSTPAKGKTLPVRYVGILRTASEVGSYHTTNAVSDMNLLGDLRHYDVYTLIPPHLAEQWAELRKAENEAAKWIVGFLENGIVASPDAIKSWRQRRADLAAFEAAHGIGGGA